MPLSVIAAILVRPWLWFTAVGAVFAMAPRKWWKVRPYLPVPDGRVISWRKVTAYGDATTDMAPHDVVSYLSWRRSNRLG